MNQNDGNEPFPLEPIILCQLAYQPGCREPKWEKVTDFKGTLQPVKIVRVHSGAAIPLNEMHPEDVAGADHHVFTSRNYVWNNACGDAVGLYDGKTFEDKAGYDPHPPEGMVFHRVGDKLVP